LTGERHPVVLLLAFDAFALAAPSRKNVSPRFSGETRAGTPSIAARSRARASPDPLATKSTRREGDGARLICLSRAGQWHTVRHAAPTAVEVPFMSRRFVIALASLTIAVAVYAWSTAGAQAPPQPQRAVAKWEYKLVKLDEKELNRLGEDGWEVVGTSIQISSEGNRIQTVSSISSRTQVILKRAR
jgi:hypothetical protein